MYLPEFLQAGQELFPNPADKSGPGHATHMQLMQGTARQTGR